LASGSPYSEYYHTAFFSAADALFQIAIGSQFGLDRMLQLDHLLSLERSCWVAILSLSDDKTRSPMYVDYEARLVEVSASTDPISVDVYLEALSSSGRVSFQLDAIKGAFLEGRFLLASVQSLSWLQARFPLLQWQQAFGNNEEESLKELCKLNFLPLFQNVSLKRDYRYRLLGLSEDRLKTLFYQMFGSLFSFGFIQCGAARPFLFQRRRMSYRLNMMQALLIFRYVMVDRFMLVVSQSRGWSKTIVSGVFRARFLILFLV